MTLSGEGRASWMKPLGLVVDGWRSPLETTYLPLDHPMTVLYGLNGAGKSFVLDALRCSFRGILSDRLRESRVYLLGQLPNSLDEWPVGLVNAFQPVTVEEMAWYRVYESLKDQLNVSWTQAWRSGYHDDFEQQAELADEFANSGVFLVRPLGVETPAWEMRPAVIPSASTPATHAFLQRIRGLNDEDALALAPVYELWREGQPPTAPTIVYSEAYTFRANSSSRPVKLWDDIIEETDLDIDEVTAEVFQTVLKAQGSVLSQHEFRQSSEIDLQEPVSNPTIKSLIADLQARTNHSYAALLRDAPALELELRPTTDWLTQTPVRWVARRLPSDAPLPIRG